MDQTTMTVEDGVATIVLDRPANRNGMTHQMIGEVYRHLVEIAARDDLRVTVLTGAGDFFCPGADLNVLTGTDGAKPDSPMDERAFRLPRLLHSMPQVTVAAINGSVAGAGLGWALACDLRIASTSARFTTAFLDRAISGDMGGPWTLTRIVGAARARELYFLPDKLDATEAHRIGLVNAIHEPEDFAPAVDRVVRRLASSAPLALREMKRNFVQADRLSFEDYLDLETLRHVGVGKSEDTMEGFRSFVEKRAPRFRGR
ncbi:MAG: enoyl-CoA hydratase/isomerase family protein [Desertimonas sp.]